MQGQPGEAARRAAEWRRLHPDAPVARIGAGAASRRRGLLARGPHGLRARAARGGRADRCEAASRGQRSRPRSRGRAYSRSPGVSRRSRPCTTPCVRPPCGAADDGLAARFLSQEARGLLDRREHARAILRFEEAIASVGGANPRSARPSPSTSPWRCTTRGERTSARPRSDGLSRPRPPRVARISSASPAETGSSCSSTAARGKTRPPRSQRWPRAPAPTGTRRACSWPCITAAAWRCGADFSPTPRATTPKPGGSARRSRTGSRSASSGSRRATAVSTRGTSEGAREAWERAAAEPSDRCRARAHRPRAARRGGLARVGRAARRGLGRARGLVRARRLRRRRKRGPLADALRRGGDPSALARPRGEASARGRRRGARRARLRTSAVRASERLAPATARRGPRAPSPARLRASMERSAAWASAGSPCATRRAARSSASAPCRRRRPPAWHPLEAGAARFALALWPPPPRETVAAVALLLETLLFRAERARGIARLRPRPGGGSAS